MKILSIILAVLLIILVLLGVGLQMFLTTALNQGVFPAVKGLYGLDMSITHASVNLFKGNAELNGFFVRNLKGYEEPMLLTFDRCRLELDMLSLLKRDPVVIDQVTVAGAKLFIERNKERQFNIQELAEALKPVESAEAPTTSTPAPTQQPAPEQPSAPPETAPAPKPVPVHIRQIAVDTLVKYTDSKRGKHYDLTLRLTGADLFTVPSADQPESLIVLRGSLAHKEDAFATDLNALVKPLTDPQNPTFTATGSILDIDADFLRELLEKNDMQSTSFSVKPSITCTSGRLDGSQINLTLRELKVYGADIGSLTLKLPLSGTLTRPAVDLPGALNSVLSEQGLKIGKTVGLRELQKEFGLGTNTTARGMLIDGLTNNVKELRENPELQELIQQIVPGAPTNAASTNKPLGETVGDALSEQLGKSVKELEGNEAVKESLRNLGKSLFGN
ncbi:MAG: AsmA family protein [Kiritimatiellales bacterium]